MKNVQVFLIGDVIAEVNGDLLDIRYSPEGVHLKWKEGTFKSTNFIPYRQIRMIRIS